MTNTIAPPTLEELNERIAAVEELRAAWQGLPSKVPFNIELYCLYAVRDGVAAGNKGEPVAYRWREIGWAHWVYDPTLEWVEEYKDDDGIEIVPLYSHPSQSPWMDIETAPKDVELLLGWWRSGLEPQWECTSGLAGSTKGGWLHGQATHWMPLPVPPTHNSPSEERRCQKCGCATKGEEALVDGQIWCHPCANNVPPIPKDNK